MSDRLVALLVYHSNDMILYNTTFIFEAGARPEPFLEWAERRYIPAALSSPGIDSHLLALIDNPADETTRSYALQLTIADETAAALWDASASELRADLESIYGKGHVVWFSTFMEVISRSSVTSIDTD